MYILRKKAESEKAFFHFITTFYNYALKVETSLAKRMVKPILETRNANDIAFDWFIYLFLDKKCKKHAM